MSFNPEQPSHTSETITQEIIPKEWVISETKSLLSSARMETISHNDFLSIIKVERLAYITDPKVIAKSITDTQKIIFDFSFGSWKVNRDLYLLTTAGQVLPDIVSTIVSNGITYSRSSLQWEFFTSSWKRLIVHDNTEINITKTRDSEEILSLMSNIENQKTSYLLKDIDMDENTLSQSIANWFDPELVSSLWLIFFQWKPNVTDEMREDFFTQIDREIWYANINSPVVDKNNLSDQNKELLKQSMFAPTQIESLLNGSDLWFKSFPWLETLASTKSIPIEVLYGLWQVESSQGYGVLSTAESKWRRSYGYFQILWENYSALWYSSKKEMVAQLGHPNKTIRDAANIQALENFIDSKSWLLSALQTKNYHQIALRYNGTWYVNLAKKTWITPYNIKLQNAVNSYTNSHNYQQVA